MAELKCKRCGTDLIANPGELVREDADGSERRRCLECFFPYEIPAKKVKKEPKAPIPEPEVGPEPESPPEE
ncbi:unnamed protein product [marine sediment metagenome]|uniref:Uncharacterized protein n=1 Tax=marine sediment metagenome TaxID=412755 RepID=X1HTC3_9ZZZZ